MTDNVARGFVVCLVCQHGISSLYDTASVEDLERSSPGVVGLAAFLLDVGWVFTRD